MDERAVGSFTAPGGETGRLFAPASAIWCLPQGRGGPDPELAGSLICPAAMRDLACRSGWAGGQMLPGDHPVWRFCGLVP